MRRLMITDTASGPVSLTYATPRVDAHPPRPNWLAVFAFVWTFVVTPGVMVLVLRRPETVTSVPLEWRGELFGGLALVGVSLIGWASAHVATERGAPFDSPFRWTALAVWAAPFANVMLGVGLILLFRELRVIQV